MKISDVIDMLQKAQREHGDIPVCTTGYYATLAVENMVVENTTWEVVSDNLRRESGLAVILLPSNAP